MSNRDIFYMKRVLTLAEKGTGFVSPNPLVGAVLVKDDKIIGEGYHQIFGQNHAEINAIKSAKVPVIGSTLYCNLEPCCHLDKKTPPCVQRIIEEGINKVIISSFDPNPKVAGRGVTLLKQAGIDVLTGVLQDQNEELNRFFLKYIVGQIPYITVKIAQTLDGKIAQDKGKQTWISNDKSKKLVHKWRAAYDAVLVGANTVFIDKPELTVREVSGRDPVKIIIDGNLRLHPNHQFFNDQRVEKTIVVTREVQEKEKIDRLKKYRCRIIQLPFSKGGIIAIEDVIKELGKNNIASILVEGGQTIFSQFLSSNFVDEVKIFVAPKLWGKGINCVENHSQEFFNNMQLFSMENIDQDVLLTYRR